MKYREGHTKLNMTFKCCQCKRIFSEEVGLGFCSDDFNCRWTADGVPLWLCSDCSDSHQLLHAIQKAT